MGYSLHILLTDLESVANSLFFHFFGDAKLPINSEHLSCFSKGGEFFPSSSIGCLLHREKGLAF